MTESGGTPIFRKLGIRPGHRVRLLRRPDGWDIPDVPGGVEFAGPPADVTVAFYRAHADLAAEAGTLAAELPDTAMLWIAWPRRAAGHDSDLTDDSLRGLFLPLGLVDVKVAALGADWSALKFVRRRENRRS